METIGAAMTAMAMTAMVVAMAVATVAMAAMAMAVVLVDPLRATGPGVRAFWLARLCFFCFLASKNLHWLEADKTWEGNKHSKHEVISCFGSRSSCANDDKLYGEKM